ncbi:MAG: Omp28-related outer membrane protein [Flavobacteriales bacterium]
MNRYLMKTTLLTLTAGLAWFGYTQVFAPQYEQPVIDPSELPAPTATVLDFQPMTRPLLQEYTSTGCPGCGSWGKPTFMELAAKHGNAITALSLHIKYRDPMITVESEALGDNRFGALFTPQIWVDGENAVLISNGGIDPGSAKHASQLIERQRAQQQPMVAAKASAKDRTLEVSYGASFQHLTPEGEYALACYLVENGIVYKQAGHAANPATHHHVLRASAEGTFGTPFTKAQLDADARLLKRHVFALTAEQRPENVHAVVVLWQRSNGRWLALNSVRS